MTWWIWALAAAALALAELLVPAWVFLGFAVGAAAMALLVAFGGPLAALLAGSWPASAVVFAVLSGLAWAVLRRWLGLRRDQVRIWKRDIND